MSNLKKMPRNHPSYNVSNEARYIIQQVFGNHNEYPYTDVGGSSPGPRQMEAVLKNCRKHNISIKDIYQINSLGLRSDELISEHSAKHVLFAGCSLTVGDGLPLEYTWAYKTYQQISENERLSGYFNIAQSGSSSNWILIQVLKYIVKYGIPDTIFINFPEPTRELGYIENKEMVQTITTNLYSIVHSIVLENGGRVISFSWDNSVNHGGSGKQDFPEDARFFLKDFYQYDNENDKQRHMYEFKQSYQRTGSYIDEYLLYAMDGEHPGLAEQDFYATFAYKIYSSVII